MSKSPDAFRTIREVADWLGVAAHVLRFWESKFSQIRPVKRAGGRRYYRPADMELVGGIKVLLHDRGMTVRGVQRMLREEGVAAVAALSPPLDAIAIPPELVEGIVDEDAWMEDARADGARMAAEDAEDAEDDEGDEDDLPPRVARPAAGTAEGAAAIPAQIPEPEPELELEPEPEPEPVRQPERALSRAPAAPSATPLTAPPATMPAVASARPLPAAGPMPQTASQGLDRLAAFVAVARDAAPDNRPRLRPAINALIRLKERMETPVDGTGG